MPVHSTWLAGVVTLLLGKRSGLGGGVGTKHVHQPPKMPKNVGFGGWCTRLEIRVDAERDGGVG